MRLFFEPLIQRFDHFQDPRKASDAIHCILQRAEHFQVEIEGIAKTFTLNDGYCRFVGFETARLRARHKHGRRLDIEFQISVLIVILEPQLDSLEINTKLMKSPNPRDIY